MAYRKLIFDLEKLKKIRKHRELSQRELSARMHYSVHQICQIERGERNFTPESYAKFKIVLDVEDVPYSSDEILSYRGELCDWKNMLLMGNINKAKELLPDFKRRTELCFDNHIQNLFDLYSLEYYHTMDDMKTFHIVLAQIKDRANELNKECLYWYHRALGHTEIERWQLKNALAEFYNAREIRRQFNIRDEALNLSIGFCLLNMGDNLGAMKHLKKAQKKIAKKFNTRYKLLLHLYTARGYGLQGKYSKSLSMLNQMLHEDREKLKTHGLEGSFIRSIADIYHKFGDFDKAVEYINESLLYFHVDGEQYVYTLYKKAVMLAGCERITESIACINKAKDICANDETVCGILLKMLSHSLQLDKPASFNYMKRYAIPHLEQRGMYLEAIEYYEKLSEYCSKKSKLRDSLTFLSKAYTLHKKLTQGDVGV